MLHYIKGVITETLPGMVCIETGGIGYEVNVPDGAVRILPGSGDIVTLYTALIVREDDVSLYGFPDRENLAMFRLLLAVSGIGPKAALAILSVLPARELKRAVIFEDVAAITKANGVGKKGAQRVVMELKDKVGLPDDLPEGITTAQINAPNTARDEAVAALIALGFSRTEAMTSVVGIEGDGLTSEDYIKSALRQRR
jgi:Holliday junction DNA helicase RuvA